MPIYYILIGFVIGAALAILYFNLRYPTVGKWHINMDNPEKDIFQVEFTRHPDVMYRKTWVVFQVVREKNTSYSGQ